MVVKHNKLITFITCFYYYNVKGKEFKSYYITRTKTMREKRERKKEIEVENFIQFLENGK